MRLPSFFHSYFLIGVFSAAFLLILIGLVLVFSGLSAERSLIVHFSAEKGIDFFGSRADVFNIVIISLSVLLINLFLAAALFEKERILPYILGIASFIFSFLILAAIMAIVWIN